MLQNYYSVLCAVMVAFLALAREFAGKQQPWIFESPRGDTFMQFLEAAQTPQQRLSQIGQRMTAEALRIEKSCLTCRTP